MISVVIHALEDHPCIELLSALYTDERGALLIEVESQALEPVPGTLHKSHVVRLGTG